MLTIELPWPDRALSPNNRDMWANIRAKKAAKNYAWGMTKAAMGPLGIRVGSWSGEIKVHLEFIPAINRSRDEDNFVASMKAGLDGIASALGVDDANFRLSHSFRPKAGKACVRVTLVPAIAEIELRGQING